MADEPNTAAVEEKQPESKDSGYKYARDHRKSFKTLGKELADENRKAVKSNDSNDTGTPPVEHEENKEATPAPEAETSKEEERIVHNRKLVEEAAVKAAEEAAAKTAEKIKEQLPKAEEPKKEEAKPKEESKPKERAKPKWAQEGRTPQSYDEIYEEAKAHALEEMRQELQAQREREQAQAQEKAAAEKAETEAREQAESEYRASVEKMTMDELEELYSEGVMKRPVDENNPEDPAVVEKRKLFEKALEVNTERMKNGQPPIISISRIFYNHFKPTDVKPKQPAGADAPVAGAASTRSENQRQPVYNYAEDHGKTMRQIMREVTRR